VPKGRSRPYRLHISGLHVAGTMTTQLVVSAKDVTPVQAISLTIRVKDRLLFLVLGRSSLASPSARLRTTSSRSSPQARNSYQVVLLRGRLRELRARTLRPAKLLKLDEVAREIDNADRQNQFGTTEAFKAAAAKAATLLEQIETDVLKQAPT